MSYRYDLQVHTDASPCSRTSPTDVVAAAAKAGLDGIVVTDHDTMSNVNATREASPADLEIVPGVEVTTTQGHLLAIDVQEPPPQTDPLTVIDDVHDQDGFAVLSHPFDTLRQYYDEQLDEIATAVDAVETTNSRCVRESFNRRASRYATEHDLPEMGGSDAHFPMEVGRAYTVTERPLRAALDSGETQSRGRGRYVSGHVATKLHQFLSKL